MAIVNFHSHPEETYLVVGTGQDTSLAPRACKQAYLHTYRLLDEGRRIELHHKTEVDDIPTALIAFQGRLLAGVGKALRLYDLGRKKLLRKAENKVRFFDPPISFTQPTHSAFLPRRVSRP